MEANKIGQLLIDNKFLTKEQLKNTLDKQKKLTEHKRLGDLLIEDGIITRRALDVIMHIQQIKREKEVKKETQPDEKTVIQTAKPGISNKTWGDFEESGTDRTSDLTNMTTSLFNVDERLKSLEEQIGEMNKSVSDSQAELKKLMRQAIRLMPRKR